jgi:outer membrane protein assembly factor BamB
MGGLAHEGSTVFVPCPSELRVLTVSDTGFAEKWSASVHSPGPPIVAAGAVWVLDVSAGRLHALDGETGEEVFSAAVGAVTHFSTPSAGDQTVFVAGGRKVEAFNTAAAGSPIP